LWKQGVGFKSKSEAAQLEAFGKNVTRNYEQENANNG